MKPVLFCALVVVACNGQPQGPTIPPGPGEPYPDPETSIISAVNTTGGAAAGGMPGSESQLAKGTATPSSATGSTNSGGAAVLAPDQQESLPTGSTGTGGGTNLPHRGQTSGQDTGGYIY
jgi:hypothetical protein